MLPKESQASPFGSKKQEARSKKQEARSKKQEARGKKQEARSKKQEARSKGASKGGCLNIRLAGRNTKIKLRIKIRYYYLG